MGNRRWCAFRVMQMIWAWLFENGGVFLTYAMLSPSKGSRPADRNAPAIRRRLGLHAPRAGAFEDALAGRSENTTAAISASRGQRPAHSESGVRLRSVSTAGGLPVS